MAVFTVQLDDKTSGPANAAGSAVTSLSDQFNALQSELRAAEAALDAENIALQQNANLLRAAGEAASIAAQQKASFAFHDKTAYKAADPMAGVAAQQKATLDSYATAAEAAAGRERDALAKVAEQQRANLANYDAMAAKQDAQMADIAAQQKKNLAMHDQNRDAAIGLAEHKAAQQAKTSLTELHAGLNLYREALDIVIARVQAFVGVIAAAISMAVSLTQEKDQLRSTFDVFTNGMGGKLLDELGELAEQLPFTGDKLEAWAKSLLSAGIQGDALKTSIKAIASATAIMGEAGAAAAEGLIKRFATMAETGQKVSLDRKIIAQLNAAGVSVAALAKELGVAPEKLAEMKLGAKELGDAMQRALIAQGAGPLEKLGNTWGSIAAKVKEGFEEAFEDLGGIVDPFMSEVKSLASEFFAGSVAVNDWKDVMKAAFTVAFEAGAKFVRWVHVGFLEAQIAVLKFRVAIKPITSTLDELLPKGLAVKIMLEGLKTAMILVAIAAVVVGAAMFIALLPLMILGAAIALVVYGLYSLGSAIYDQISGIIDLGGAAIKAGVAFIQGLGNAISAGTPWVIGLVTQLAAGIIAAIVGPLAIRSPSRVMMKLGQHTTAGLAEGIERGSGDVKMAARGAAGAAVDGAAGGLAGGKGGGTMVNVEAGAVVIHGAGGDVMSLTEEALTLLLERVLLLKGAQA